MQLKEVIEALVFASQKPLSPKEMVAALRSAIDDSDEEIARALSKTKEAEVAAVLEELKIDYIQANRAFQLVEQVNGWAVVTKPEYALWVRQLYPESKPSRLSGPALETLAIVAYRQPITKADIEAVRGVAVDGVMQSLLDRGLVRIAGRADVPGRPLLYETTQVFMEHFGLRNLEELPNSDELRRVNLPTAPVPAEAELEKEKPAKGRKGKAAAAEAGTSEQPAAAEAGEQTPVLPHLDEAQPAPAAPETVEETAEPVETFTPEESAAGNVAVETEANSAAVEPVPEPAETPEPASTEAVDRETPATES